MSDLLTQKRLVTIKWSDGSSEGWDPDTQVYPVAITVETTTEVVPAHQGEGGT